MAKQFKNGHAVIVGVGADLPNTVNDAAGLADILKDSGRCAYPADQVHLLTEKQASRDDILTALDALSKSTDDKATVVIYFSGHGHQVTSTTGEAYYLMPYGYDTEKLFKTAISGVEFTDRLRAIPAQKLIVLLDCCHAGGVGDAKVPRAKLTKSPLPLEAHNLLSEGKGRILIASSQEDEYSYAGKPYSAFTLALIEALCGQGVAKKDGYVRVADLALHTRQMVPGRTEDKQHPILHFEHADNFVIAYYAGGDVKLKGLPFTEAPEIEPEPGAWNRINQSGQIVHGQQTTIAGDVVGQVASGKFDGPTSIGEGDAVNMRESKGSVYKPSGSVQQHFGEKHEVHMKSGFYQPDWNVRGNAIQANRDIIMVGQEVSQVSEGPSGIFDELIKQTETLSAADQAIVKLIIEQAQVQVENLQQCDESAEAQSFLQQRLKNLLAIAPDIGGAAVAAIVSAPADVSIVIKKIAEKVHSEFKYNSKK